MIGIIITYYCLVDCMLEINNIKGWTKDHWKCTTPGNWQEYLADNNGLKIWLTNPGSKYWNVKVGKDSRLGNSSIICSQLDSRNIALSKAIEFMEKNPTIEYNGGIPKFVDENGDSYTKI